MEIGVQQATEASQFTGTHMLYVSKQIHYNHTHTHTHSVLASYYPIISMISSAEVLVSCRAAIQHIGLKQNMLQL